MSAKWTGFFLLSMSVVLAVVSPGFSGTLPDTGQTTCYDASGNVVSPCPSEGEAFHGQDANYPISVPSFTKLDETGADLDDSATSWTMVRDEVTGLIWEVKTTDAGINDAGDAYSRANADSVFISSLNTNSFGGFSDWRIPSREELRSIVDYGRFSPAIDTDFFPNTQTNVAYWSSDANNASSTQSWVINFSDGSDDIEDNAFSLRVRAVRGAALLPTPDFTDNGDGTVTDNRTGLVWEQVGTTDERTWENALAYCEGLTLGNETDWRLPNLKELASIIDLGRNNPAIDETFFTLPNDSLIYYWTSTTKSDSPNSAWRILTHSSGADTDRSKTSSYYVRAVRGGALEAPIPGNLNADATVDLQDAIIALKILAGVDPDGYSSPFTADQVSVNGDALIGLEEAVYALQAVASLR